MNSKERAIKALPLQVGNVNIYILKNGIVSCAVDDQWINALFHSPEAALSWNGHWDEAEEEFRSLNPPPDFSDNLLGYRS